MAIPQYQETFGSQQKIKAGSGDTLGLSPSKGLVASPNGFYLKDRFFMWSAMTKPTIKESSFFANNLNANDWDRITSYFDQNISTECSITYFEKLSDTEYEAHQVTGNQALFMLRRLQDQARRSGSCLDVEVKRYFPHLWYYSVPHNIKLVPREK